MQETERELVPHTGREGGRAEHLDGASSLKIRNVAWWGPTCQTSWCSRG